MLLLEPDYLLFFAVELDAEARHLVFELAHLLNALGVGRAQRGDFARGRGVPHPDAAEQQGYESQANEMPLVRGEPVSRFFEPRLDCRYYFRHVGVIRLLHTFPIPAGWRGA